jgi:hypothetical protein
LELGRTFIFILKGFAKSGLIGTINNTDMHGVAINILQIGGEIMDLPTAIFVVALIGLVVQIIAVTKK